MNADDIWSLTPREITARLTANQRKLYHGDLMAWIGARYIALSVHAPEKLPEAPLFFPEEGEREEMSGEEMKNRFSLFRKEKKNDS